MAKIKFTGTNESGFYDVGPYHFVCGGPAVDVDDAATVEKLRRHPEFEVSGKSADPFDHDEDGKPGGSKPRESLSLKKG